MEFTISNVHYPKKRKRKGIQGKVVAKFTIDKEGNLKDIGIVKGLEDMYNKEVKRVIQSMPKWKPGFQDGKAVDCSYMLPVMFTLED